MKGLTRIMTAAVALTVGTVAGTDVLGGQQHHPRDTAAAGVPAGHHTMQMQMMAMCHGMMGGEGMMSQGMMSEQGMMADQGMMAVMSPQPAMLLHQREALGLTDDQVERLEEMGEEASASAESHMAEMERLNGEIRATLAAEAPDLGRLETLLEDRAETQVEMQLERARRSQEARSLLTEQQRSNLRYGTALMRGMMRRMMERMPMEDGGTGPHPRGGPGD